MKRVLTFIPIALAILLSCEQPSSPVQVTASSPEISISFNGVDIYEKYDDNLNFGPVHTGSSSVELSLTITNEGTADLQITDIEVMDSRYREVFSFITEPDAIIKPQHSSSFSMVFNPLDSMEYTTSLKIESNAKTLPYYYIDLEGQGVMTSAPVVSGITPTSETQPSWTWTIPEGAIKIRYNLNDTQWTETEISTTSFAPASPLAEGSHTLEVQAMDASETWSSSGSHTIVIDTSGPGIPQVSIDTPTSNQRPTWHWTIPAESVEIRYRLDNVEWFYRSNTSLNSFTPRMNLAEGTHTLEVQAKDGLNNWSISGSASVRIDISPPEAPAITGPVITNDTTPTWNWNIPAETVSFRYKINDGIATSTPGTDVTSHTSDQILTEGIHTFSVQGADSLGNWSSWAVFTTEIDLTAPSIPMVSGPSLTNNPRPTWTWDIPNETTDIRINLNGQGWTVLGNGTSTSFTPGSDLTDGSHSLAVQVMDDTSNWSDSGSFTIVIDSVAPAAPSVSGVAFTQDTTPSWTWTVPGDAVDFRYRLDQGNWTETGGTNDTQWTADSPLSESEHSFEVQARDSAGNWSVSGSFLTNIDLSAPSAPIVSISSWSTVDKPTWTWTLTEQNLVNIRYSLDSAPWVELGTGTALSFTPDTPLNEGRHTLEVQLCDAALNWSTSGSAETNIDTIPPGRPRVSGPDRTANRRPTWDWNEPYGIEGWRYRLNGGDWIIPENTFTSEYTPDSDLPEGTHIFDLQFRDYAGNWSETGTKTTVIEVIPPSAPSITELTMTETGEISISWAGNSGTETGYTLERKTGAGAFVEILSNTSARSYDDSDTTEETSYTYRLKALNEAGSSQYCTEESILFTLYSPSLSISSDHDDGLYGLTLSWTDNSNCEDSYVLERRISGLQQDFQPLTTLPSGTLTFFDQTVQEDSLAIYRIKAVSLSGNESAYDSASSNTSIRCVKDLTLSNWSYRDSITLYWTDDSAVESSYIVKRATTPSGPYTELAELPADSTEYTDDTIGITDYYYQVYSTKDYGNYFTLSESVYISTVDITVKPIDYFSVVESNSALKLFWTIDSQSLHDNFTIERKENYYDDYAPLIELDSTASSYEDTSVSPGVTYYYRISAYNSEFRSAYVEDSDSVTLVINSPNNLAVQDKTATTVQLTWNDRADNETGFEIERKEASSSSYVYVGSTSANSTSYTDTNLDPETTYNYRVRARSSNTYSSYSMPIAVTTNALPAAPSGLDVSVDSNITLTWNYAPGAADSFTIERYINSNTLQYRDTVTGSTMTYTDSSLDPGVNYRYRVYANDRNGRSTSASLYVTNIPAGAQELTADSTWHEFDLSSSADIDWYYIQVQENDVYNIHWDDSYQGSGVCTADIEVTLFRRDTGHESGYFYSEDTAYVTPMNISCDRTEILYFKVNRRNGGAGTYRFAIQQVSP